MFRDPQVRRALTLAIDRQELHRAANLPEDTPIFDVFYTQRQLDAGRSRRRCPRAELPMTPLSPLRWTHVVHRRVQGLGLPFRYDPLWYAEDLWLGEGR